LVAQLDTSNGWRRDTAQRLLVHRRDDSVVPALAALLTSSNHSIAKVHALGTLYGLGHLTSEHVATALSDGDTRVVTQAVAWSEPFLNHSSLGQELVPLVQTQDAELRMQLALTLGQWQAPQAADALVQLARRADDDPWLRAAVLSSSATHAPRMLAALLSQPNEGDARTELIQHLITTAVGSDKQGGLENILASIVGQGAAVQTWQLEALDRFDRALRRRRSSLLVMRGQAAETSQPLFQRAERILAEARTGATDQSAETPRRLAAIRLLGRGFDPHQDDVDLLTQLLTPQQSVEVQIAAAQTLADINSEPAVDGMLANWRRLSPKVQSEILAALLSRGAWQQRLIEAIEQGTVAVADLDATARQRLESLTDGELLHRIRPLLGQSPDRDRDQVIARYSTVSQLEGDVTRGAELFKKTCAACHRHREIGNEIGPALAALQNKSDENLLVGVLDPNRAVEGKYKSYSCATTDGRVISGMIVEETGNSITLAQANGTKVPLLRVDIESLTSSGLSQMPVGLEKDLTPQQLADVFRFIRSE
jgi:putative heme-binding domain-containing protein